MSGCSNKKCVNRMFACGNFIDFNIFLPSVVMVHGNEPLKKHPLSCTFIHGHLRNYTSKTNDLKYVFNPISLPGFSNCLINPFYFVFIVYFDSELKYV